MEPDRIRDLKPIRQKISIEFVGLDRLVLKTWDYEVDVDLRMDKSGFRMDFLEFAGKTKLRKSGANDTAIQKPEEFVFGYVATSNQVCS